MLSGCLVAALVAGFAQDPPQEPAIRGRLVDVEGAPSAGVTLAQSWSYPEPASWPDDAPVPPKAMQGSLAFQTDEDGVFAGPLAGRSLPTVLFAIDVERGLGRAVVVREPGDQGELVLEPLASLTGSFRFRTAGEQPVRAGARLMWDEGGVSGLSLVSFLDDATRAFAFRLPAGSYRLHYSTDLTNLFTMPPTEHRPRLAPGQALELGALEIGLRATACWATRRACSSARTARCSPPSRASRP